MQLYANIHILYIKKKLNEAGRGGNSSVVGFMVFNATFNNISVILWQLCKIIPNQLPKDISIL